MPALLEVSRLAVHYRPPGATAPVAALEDASLDVAAGAVVGLLGESGAGKTTLIDAVLGLLPKTARASGSIRLAGRELVGLAEAEHRRLRGKALALIPQDPGVALNPVRRAGPQVAEIVAAHDGGDAARVRAQALEALASVGLPAEVYDAYPHQLSGGQRQRVTIAQALCCGPALLLADEPTAALDSVTQAGLRALLGDLRARRGLALLLVSHDVGLLLALADRVVVLADGRTVEEGPTASVVRAPRDPYTRRLMAAVPRAGRVHGG